MKRGETVGGLTLVKRLGRGGNGEVWRARKPGHQDVAVKILAAPGGERLQRFCSEIRFLQSQTTNNGVLRIIDANFDPRKAPLWYSMPIAAPLQTALGRDPSLEAAIAAFEMFSGTLSRLASDGIAHRDLKPDNLFRLGDRYVVGDFGLVRYPEADR